MASDNDRERDELRRLRARVEQLEEANRFTIDALAMAARLGNFQPTADTLTTPESILQETSRRIGELIRFNGTAMLLVDEATMGLTPAYLDQPDKKDFFLAQFEHLTDDRTMAWALRRKQPSYATTSDNSSQLLLHPISTADKTLGFFMGLLAEDQESILDISLSILSIVLLNSANALNHLILTQHKETARKELEAKVEELGLEVKRRMQSELGLESTRNFLNEVINTVPEPIFVKDRKHRFLMINDAFTFFSGQTRESLLGKTSYDIFPREEADAFHRKDAKVMLSGREDTHETRVSTPDGLRHHISVKKASLTDPETGENVLVGILRNLTDQKEATNALARSEAKYRELVENANSIIIRWTKAGFLTFFNEFAQSFFGYTEEEVIGRHMVGTIVPMTESTGRNLGPLMEEIAAYPRAFTQNENENIRSDGKRVWVSWSNRGIYDEHGELTEILSIGTDISERVAMEKELRKASLEAEAASKAKSEFLANMSHEIRTPLNGVLGMLQLASALGVDGELGDYVETALESGRSLLTVINDILDFSKIEAGKFDITRSSFSPRQVVESVVRTFAHQSRETGIALTCDIGDDVPDVLIGDGGRIRQVLFNLVGNAMKFTHQGAVSVSIHKLTKSNGAKHRLLFIVQDSGIGIPDDKVDYVFDAFTQVDGSYRRKYQGSGLGLGIVKRLVHLMGGTITIDTEIGDGTTIAFALDMEALTGVMPVRESGPLIQSIDPSSCRLLLAEDNRVNQILARKGLEKLGFTVDCADNGAEVLNALDVEDYDCILLDVQMPVMDGIETSRRIRKGEAGSINRNLPIIAITAHAMRKDRDRFLASGMDAVVTKPYEFEELLDTLNRVLTKRSD